MSYSCNILNRKSTITSKLVHSLMFWFSALTLNEGSRGEGRRGEGGGRVTIYLSQQPVNLLEAMVKIRQDKKIRKDLVSFGKTLQLFVLKNAAKNWKTFCLSWIKLTFSLLLVARGSGTFDINIPLSYKLCFNDPYQNKRSAFLTLLVGFLSTRRTVETG